MYVLINKNWGKIVETYLLDGRANVVFENGKHRILNIRRQNSEQLQREIIVALISIALILICKIYYPTLMILNAKRNYNMKFKQF
jgi:hypothetical protein